ncbi:hypothetical protein VTL71DRAFT_11984 [Oculimacula yallundae]|uniref:F-box domain-containing protein n=1 Tax=Oculimacula yallundae TaxID=86028 RepID=A0ABR4CRP4_9HELO
MDIKDEIPENISHVTPVANSLHTLPSELRIKIFQYLCCSGWTGQVPNIIKALRCDWVLYHEALEEFYRSGVFVFCRENGWSFRDMTQQAVKTITRAGIMVEQGIMHKGLWRVRNPGTETMYSPEREPATISDATNIRKLLIQFESERETEDIIPFTAFGQVTFSLNYFITSFKQLKVVEMILPARSVSQGPYVKLLREKKFDFGIKGINSRMGVVGRLRAVRALCHTEGLDEHDSRIQALLDILRLESGERWFWEANDGCFLGGRREVEELETIGSVVEDLEHNPWRE